jgi:hypothetical protein
LFISRTEELTKDKMSIVVPDAMHRAGGSFTADKESMATMDAVPINTEYQDYEEEELNERVCDEEVMK